MPPLRIVTSLMSGMPDLFVAALRYIFETIEEAHDQATEWLWTYNNERPNMGIGGMTPAMKLKTAA